MCMHACLSNSCIKGCTMYLHARLAFLWSACVLALLAFMVDILDVDDRRWHWGLHIGSSMWRRDEACSGIPNDIKRMIFICLDSWESHVIAIDAIHILWACFQKDFSDKLSTQRQVTRLNNLQLLQLSCYRTAAVTKQSSLVSWSSTNMTFYGSCNWI